MCEWCNMVMFVLLTKAYCRNFGGQTPAQTEVHVNSHSKGTSLWQCLHFSEPCSTVDSQLESEVSVRFR